MNSSLVAKRLKRGACSDGKRGRLLERRVGWLEHYVIFAGGNVLREGAHPQAEHFIARLELRDALPDRLDDAGNVDPDALVLRCANAGAMVRSYWQSC